MAQTVREGRGADKRGDTGNVSELSSPTSEIASYDWYNNDVEYGQPPQLIESSEQSDLPEGMGAASAEFTGEMSPAEKWVAEAQGKGDNALHDISNAAQRNLAEQQGRAPQEMPKVDLNGMLTSKTANTAQNSAKH